jgi:hypothetical protein
MGIAVNTVRNNLTSIHSRLGAMSQTEAAARLGWLTIPESAYGMDEHGRLNGRRVVPKHRRQGPATICAHCGDSFFTDRVRKKQYCDKSCAGKARAAAGVGIHEPWYRTSRRKRLRFTCHQCGSVRVFQQSTANRRKHCSRSCANRCRTSQAPCIRVAGP